MAFAEAESPIATLGGCASRGFSIFGVGGRVDFLTLLVCVMAVFQQGGFVGLRFG